MNFMDLLQLVDAIIQLRVLLVEPFDMAVGALNRIPRVVVLRVQPAVVDPLISIQDEDPPHGEARRRQLRNHQPVH